MIVFEGIFELRGPKDLLGKLRHDYGRLERDPSDAYAAFDFFVTAEHMLDWLYSEDPSQKQKIRSGEILLEVCSHVASGSKHFRATAKRHRSVSGTAERPGTFQRGAFQADAFQVAGLAIDLQGDAARLLGPTVDALDLARKVLDYWEGHPDLGDR